MYGPQSQLIPKDIRARTKVREWMAASEGTYILHAITVSLRLFGRGVLFDVLREECGDDQANGT